jgi:anti-sigma B factor antagonist
MQRRRRPATDTVHLAGDLDMARQDELFDIVVLLDPQPHTTIRLDMGEVTFVDSTGLSSILKILIYLRARHCKLVVLHPQSQLRRVIELSGLDELLPVDDGDRDERAVPRPRWRGSKASG